MATCASKHAVGYKGDLCEPLALGAGKVSDPNMRLDTVAPHNDAPAALRAEPFCLVRMLS